MNFHLLNYTLACKRVNIKYLLTTLLNKTNYCIVLPFIDKTSKLKKIYRICLCIYKNFYTDFHTNPNNLNLFVIPLIGSIAINNKQLRYLRLTSFNYSQPIKIESKFNISIFILKRNFS